MYIIKQHPVSHSCSLDTRPRDLAGICTTAVDYMQSCITRTGALTFGLNPPQFFLGVNIVVLDDQNGFESTRVRPNVLLEAEGWEAHKFWSQILVDETLDLIHEAIRTEASHQTEPKHLLFDD